MSTQRSKFGIGFIVTALTGVLAGLLLSEKPGKRLRSQTKKEYEKLKNMMEEKNVDEAVREIFGKITSESRSAFIKTRKYLTVELADLKEDFSTIDKDKYKKLIDNTIDKVRDDKKIPEDGVSKLAKY